MVAVYAAKGGDIRVDMIKVRTNPKCEFKPNYPVQDNF